MDIPYIKGRELDSIALKLGLKRKKYWFIFKETDKKLRQRCEQRVHQITNRQISVIWLWIHRSINEYTKIF